MDKYNKAKDRLRRYNMDKVYLRSLREDLELLELEYGVQGVSYDDVMVSNNCTSDTTQQLAIRLVDKRTGIEFEIARREKELRHIDLVLDQLTNTEKMIIVGFYIEGKPLWKVSAEVGYSTAQVKRIKKQAMKGVVIGICG